MWMCYYGGKKIQKIPVHDFSNKFSDISAVYGNSSYIRIGQYLFLGEAKSCVCVCIYI